MVDEAITHSEAGSAVVETTVSMVFLVAVFLGVLEVAYTVHLRSTLTLAAAEGARAGAAVGAGSDVAVTHTRSFIEASMGKRDALDVRARPDRAEGEPVMLVEVETTLPVLGVFGSPFSITTRARAVMETRS